MQSKKYTIELIVFYTEIEETNQYLINGANAVIIDWECEKKLARQKLYDTQINMHAVNDLIDLRKNENAHIICRVNQFSCLKETEIDDAIYNGADELLLPMVRNVKEVEAILKKINGRCPLGILIETDDAMRNAKDYSTLPLSRVYIGLNDLAIDRGYKSIFEPVFDGSIQEIRSFFTTKFGFGGLTLPDRGSPLPCKYLINEMKKNKCTFSFLRRSFFRDARDMNASIIISKIREEFNLPAFDYPEGFDYKKMLFSN